MARGEDQVVEHFTHKGLAENKIEMLLVYLIVDISGNRVI
jgi:hypothetical protein